MEKHLKPLVQYWAGTRRGATSRGVAACQARPTDPPAGPLPGGPIQPRRWPAARERARAGCACGVVTARWPRVGRQGGAVGPRAPADKVSQKRWREHCEGGGNALDEVAAVRAHLSSGSTCGAERRRRGDVPRWRRCSSHGRCRWWGPTALGKTAMVRHDRKKREMGVAQLTEDGGWWHHWRSPAASRASRSPLVNRRHQGRGGGGERATLEHG
jgi:hypothetical protein